MQIIITVTVFLIAIVVHEVAHGYAALKVGDETARDAGRLSLNPVRHLDPVGTVLVPFFLIYAGSPVVFGWARPVPVDPGRFKSFRLGLFLTSFAGPFSNFVLAAVFGTFYRINAYFLGSAFWAAFSFYGVIISLVLGFFNLIPVPPFDGSGIISSMLPKRAIVEYNKVGKYGFIIVLALLFFGFFRRFVLPIVFLLARALMGT